MVSLNDAGRLSIKLPTFKEYGDVKGPKSPTLLKLRLLVIAFNFKEECYEYLRYEELPFKRGATVEAQEWEVDTAHLQGNLILASMSLDFYADDELTGEIGKNSKVCSPAEIIGAFHIQEAPEAVQKAALVEPEERPQSTRKIMNNYCGREMFKKLSSVGEFDPKPDIRKRKVMKVKGLDLLPQVKKAPE